VLNIRALPADFARLRRVRDANWDTRSSLAIGTCAGARVSWASHDEQVTILVSADDDETWDVAVTVPLANAEEITSLAERELDDAG
jgi:hypothetical protein